MPVMDGLAATRADPPAASAACAADRGDDGQCRARRPRSLPGGGHERTCGQALRDRRAGAPAAPPDGPTGPRAPQAPMLATGGRRRTRRPACRRAKPARVDARAHAAGVDLVRALARLGGKRPSTNACCAASSTTWPACPHSCRPSSRRATPRPPPGCCTRSRVWRPPWVRERWRPRPIAPSAPWPWPPRQPQPAPRPGLPKWPCARPARAAALLQALQDEAARPAAPARRPGPETADTVAALQELAVLLENSDMRATDLMPRLLPPAGTAPGEHWRALDEAMASLEFERALPLCR